MKAMWVVTMVADAEQGGALARLLVEEGLAGCVQVGGAVRSHYRWEGRMEEAVEHAVWIKTTEERWEALRERVVQWHPYECPEVLAFRVDDGHGPYLEWLARGCGGSVPPEPGS
jgi:periplasmic divalent cation tolerance protein